MVSRNRRQEVMNALATVPTSNQRIAGSDWTYYSNETGTHTKIADYQANQPIAVREGVPADIHIVAYEEFTNSLGSSDQTTYNLSHNIVDADSVADDLVLYEDNSAVSADSVNYSGNSFDYTDSGGGSRLHAYYVVGTQAVLEFRKTAPKSHYETMKEADAAILNRRDQSRDPAEFDFDHNLQGVVPTDWTIEVYLDAAWSFQQVDDQETSATADNLFLDVPIRRSAREIQGLSRLVTEAI